MRSGCFDFTYHHIERHVAAYSTLPLRQEDDSIFTIVAVSCIRPTCQHSRSMLPVVKEGLNGEEKWDAVTTIFLQRNVARQFGRVTHIYHSTA